MNNDEYNVFTKDENGVNLSINNLEVGCITNQNHNFSIDTEGNIVANSISTKEGINLMNALEYEPYEGNTIKLKDNKELYGTIIEKGNNINGTFIKFSDGTMICYGTKQHTVKITQKLNESLYYGYIDSVSDFPISFKEPPTVFFSHHTIGSIFAIQPYKIETITKSQTGGVYPIAPKLITEGVSISYFAIGKYK